MASYSDRMTDLSSLSDEDLKGLESEIVSAFDEADNADDLDAMSAAADDLDAVRAELENRGGGEEAPEPPAEDETDEDVAAVAASGKGKGKETSVDIPEDRKPVTASAPSVVVAGADIPNRSAGSEFHSATEVSEAFLNRMQSLRGVRTADGEQLIVASIKAPVPDPDRVLLPGDVEGNAAKIRKVTGLDAIVATGGYCAPLEVRYDIFGVGVTDRPVRDQALAGFQTTRGGIRYNTSPKLGDYTGAIGVWTAATDANPAGATKPVLRVQCTPEETATVDAVTLQLLFGNLMSRAYPELVTRHNELALIQFARYAEQRLLNQIDALSTAVTTGERLGYARDFLLAVGQAAAAYRSRHRMGRDAPLRVIAPEWVRDAMREDLSIGLPGDKLSWADAEINGFFNDRNINVTWHLEQPFGAQGAGALASWPATFRWNLYAEGTFLFLDGGTLDLGIVRDSTLVATNDYTSFVETFEGVVKLGIEALSVTTTTRVLGHVSSTIGAPAAV